MARSGGGALVAKYGGGAEDYASGWRLEFNERCGGGEGMELMEVILMEASLGVGLENYPNGY